MQSTVPKHARLLASTPASFAIIIPVMRRESLRSVARHYLSFDSALCGNLYIADFDPPFTRRLIGDELGNPRLQHVEIPNRRYFNKAVAINVAAARTSEPYLLICDADVAIPAALVREWLDILERRADRLVYLETVRETGDGSLRPGYGIVAASRHSFDRLQGFCSEFRGWGFEDRDFMRRARAAGLVLQANGTAPHLSHDEPSRTENYAEKDLMLSRERNLRLFEARRAAGHLHGTMSIDLEAMQAPASPSITARSS